MIHAEVLPDEQFACLLRLAPAATGMGFYLAGGTAVALHLGHRRSIDFDWFAPRFPRKRTGTIPVEKDRHNPCNPRGIRSRSRPPSNRASRKPSMASRFGHGSGTSRAAGRNCTDREFALEAN